MAAGGRRRSWVRTLAPWLIGAAIVVVIATQVPYARFRASLKQGPHLELAAFELLGACVVLLTDSFSTWVGLVALKIRWTLSRTAAVRGATYLLVLINYALGQGGFGYYLYRGGVSAQRAVGATLFLLGTTLASLLIMTFGVWIVADARSANEQMWWTIAIAMAAFGVYLVIVASRLKFLARREVLAPLFDAHLAGHALAIVGRLPHVIAIIFAHWGAMRMWGIPMPIEVGFTFFPAVVLASTLPISPAGLGTMQASIVFFFADYTPGATADERTAALLAFGVVHFVYSVLCTALIGLACIPFAKRTGLLATDEFKQS